MDNFLEKVSGGSTTDTHEQQDTSYVTLRDVVVNSGNKLNLELDLAGSFNFFTVSTSTVYNETSRHDYARENQESVMDNVGTNRTIK